MVLAVTFVVLQYCGSLSRDAVGPGRLVVHSFGQTMSNRSNSLDAIWPFIYGIYGLLRQVAVAPGIEEPRLRNLLA